MALSSFSSLNSLTSAILSCRNSILSPGEQQRIMFARLRLYPPPYPPPFRPCLSFHLLVLVLPLLPFPSITWTAGYSIINLSSPSSTRQPALSPR
eukprot:747283-Hanusia_phi.AAC.1